MPTVLCVLIKQLIFNVEKFQRKISSNHQAQLRTIHCIFSSWQNQSDRCKWKTTPNTWVQRTVFIHKLSSITFVRNRRLFSLRIHNRMQLELCMCQINTSQGASKFLEKCSLAHAQNKFGFCIEWSHVEWIQCWFEVNLCESGENSFVFSLNYAFYLLFSRFKRRGTLTYTHIHTRARARNIMRMKNLFLFFE